MKTFGIVVLLILVCFLIVGFTSKPKNANGLVSGKLTECSSKPNCVSSEHDESDSHFVAPIKMQPIVVVKQVILQMGGVIVEEKDNYIAATFTSFLFRFVDDFEVRLDGSAGLMHVRSASRVGHSDFGVNRKRVEQFRAAFNEGQQKQ